MIRDLFIMDDPVETVPRRMLYLQSPAVSTWTDYFRSKCEVVGTGQYLNRFGELVTVKRCLTDGCTEIVQTWPDGMVQE